jgi:hypothetical protein
MVKIHSQGRPSSGDIVHQEICTPTNPDLRDRDQNQQDERNDQQGSGEPSQAMFLRHGAW